MQFFTPGSSKMEVFEICFFDILTIQNDHPRYVKHVLGRIYMFLTLFGYLVRGGGGGAPKGLDFSPIFAMLAVLATSLTPWYPL